MSHWLLCPGVPMSPAGSMACEWLGLGFSFCHLPGAPDPFFSWDLLKFAHPCSSQGTQGAEMCGEGGKAWVKPALVMFEVPDVSTPSQNPRIWVGKDLQGH